MTIGKRDHSGDLRSPPLSASTSGSAGSPPTDPAPTPARDNGAGVIGTAKIEIGAGAPSAKKKRRGARQIASDTSGRGLRQYSMKVCEKVESKGRTTYNEVADELVAEFADPSNDLTTPDLDEEKNIRRRIYDALNVLMAMDIISKDKKQIQWKGLPRTSENDIEELKAERNRLKTTIQKKTPYLQELENQLSGLQNLKQRNEKLHGSGNSPGGVELPFILVQTRPQATVEVEISEDMQLVHFDFNSTPFELHDDSYVLKAMRYYGNEQKEGAPDPSSNGYGGSSPVGIYEHGIPQLMKLNAIGRSPATPPLPGIIKAPRLKQYQM